MLEHLAGDDDVEGTGVERKLVLDVPVQRLDPPLGSLLQRRCIDVHADDLVAREKMLRHGTRPTAQVEDTAPGPPTAATSSGTRSGTKTNSPSARRSR